MKISFKFQGKDQQQKQQPKPDLRRFGSRIASNAISTSRHTHRIAMRSALAPRFNAEEASIYFPSPIRGG